MANKFTFSVIFATTVFIGRATGADSSQPTVACKSILRAVPLNASETHGMDTGRDGLPPLAKFLNGSGNLQPDELQAAVNMLNDYLLCAAEANGYDKLVGSPTNFQIRLWKAQSPFDINETSASYTSPLRLTLEWNDERLSALALVLNATFGHLVIERFNSLPLRDEDLNRIWIPSFSFYGSYPLYSVSGVDLNNGQFLRDLRLNPSSIVDTYGIFAEVNFERVTDCRINSRHFPFDTTLCFMYLRFPKVNGKSREPFVPRLSEWYRPTQFYASSVKQLKLEIIPSGLERDLMSTDEKWREQDTRAFCQKTSVFGAGYDVDCFIFFRFTRVSEKYVYPWLVTLNALTLGTIIGMYKGSDPSERFSLGALGLVPTSLGLYSLVDAIPIGYEGYPIVGYYWLALFINSLVAMLCCNIPLWMVHNHAEILLAGASGYYGEGNAKSGVAQYLTAVGTLNKIRSVQSMSSLRSVTTGAEDVTGEMSLRRTPVATLNSVREEQQETEFRTPNPLIGDVSSRTARRLARKSLRKSIAHWFLLWSDVTIMFVFVIIQVIINITVILLWSQGSSDDVTDFVKRSVKLPSLISGAKKIILSELGNDVTVRNLTMK